VTGTPGRIVLKAGAATDVGRLRSVNQDSYVLLPDRGLYVVADGMGGHQGGEVASQLAVETLQVAYLDPTEGALTDAIAVANHRIRNEGDRDPNLRGMGTTVVAAALMPIPTDGEGDEDDDTDAGLPDHEGPQHLVIANVGDSRGYLFRDSSLVQLTEDHSVVADLVREGRITEAEAEVHPQRNIVTRVLGVYESVQVDLWKVDPVRGDRYLLCSDGLFNEVTLDQITSVLRRLADPQEAAEELVRLANAGGGRDNITVVLLDVVDDGGIAIAASEALADEPSRTSAAPAEADLAGFSTAMDDDAGPVAAGAAEPVPSRRERRAARKAAKQRRTRFTWRFGVFVLLVLGVIGGAVATIQWYGTSTYFLGFDGDEVVIYQGRPGGLLWIEPEVEQRTGIVRDDVPPSYLDGLEAGNEQPSLARARQVVENIERDRDELAEDTAPPSTTSTSTTSTTRPTTTTAAGTATN
jgi:serine/threonine protein phosphatase PrpC